MITVREVINDDLVFDPTEILIKCYEKLGAKFDPKTLQIMRHYKPETLLRESRNWTKPNQTKRML